MPYLAPNRVSFLDNILRSLLYAHFSESLSGLSTIRSYGEVNRFVRDNEYYIDLEDRAAYLTITNQRSVCLEEWGFDLTNNRCL